MIPVAMELATLAPPAGTGAEAVLWYVGTKLFAGVLVGVPLVFGVRMLTTPPRPTPSRR